MWVEFSLVSGKSLAKALEFELLVARLAFQGKQSEVQCSVRKGVEFQAKSSSRSNKPACGLESPLVGM